MPAFVLDASATMPWYFADESTEAANALFRATPDGQSPLFKALTIPIPPFTEPTIDMTNMVICAMIAA